ncbi:MAG TPA: hypothetical protein P5084_10630, partial [Paludibacter sp.]|nr:hypothetical protein [Paludibacter sp.]
ILKTEEATRNLFLLYQTGQYPFLAEESNLLTGFLKLQKTGLTRLFATKFDITKKIFRKQLSSTNPSLLLFDVYKLLFLCKTSLTK